MSNCVVRKNGLCLMGTKFVGYIVKGEAVCLECLNWQKDYTTICTTVYREEDLSAEFLICGRCYRQLRDVHEKYFDAWQ